MRPDPMMMTTMLMKELDQIKTTQVTNMIPYLHACLLALLFASPLYLPWGLILLAFFFTCYLQCRYFVWLAAGHSYTLF